MQLTDTLVVNKPAGNLDGYAGGTQAIRDTTNVSGGLRGNVNCVSFSYTIAGKNVKTFEWNNLSILNNHADEGENCSAYFQSNKFGNGPTWGTCTEICTLDELSGSEVAQEVDIWTTGKDTGFRIASDIVVGDSKFIRKGIRSTIAEATSAIRVGASGATPWARFIFGVILNSFKGCGLLLDSVADRAIWLKGKYIVGIDLSGAETQSAIRLAPGQKMTFEPTDAISWSWLNGRLRVQNSGLSILEIDTSTGDVYKLGKKVL